MARWQTSRTDLPAQIDNDVLNDEHSRNFGPLADIGSVSVSGSLSSHPHD
jgi:hypothetical protein